MNYEPGNFCTVNGNCDGFLDAAKAVFKGKKCIIVKRCKSGLLLLALDEDSRVKNSFAEFNISKWRNE